ncbi:MAG: hypothetical protein ACM34D_03475 [Gemmatimonadota bacterium]
MTIRANPPGMEPSPEAVVAMRERLRGLGFLLTEDAARDLLRGILGIESARLDRRAREAAAACLRSIQDAAREALAILTQGPAAVTAPMAAVGAPVAKPAPAPKRDQPVNLAEIVRQRLGDDAPRDDPASRPHEPLAPPPPRPPPSSAPAGSQSRAPAPGPSPAEPRRPVFKGRRGR